MHWQGLDCAPRNHLLFNSRHSVASQGVPGAINSNDYATHRASYRLAKVLVMRLRGSACFDFEYYRSRSRDLSSWPQAQLWDHFVQDGQFEGRSFRWGGMSASLDSPLQAPEHDSHATQNSCCSAWPIQYSQHAGMHAGSHARASCAVRLWPRQPCALSAKMRNASWMLPQRRPWLQSGLPRRAHQPRMRQRQPLWWQRVCRLWESRRARCLGPASLSRLARAVMAGLLVPKHLLRRTATCGHEAGLPRMKRHRPLGAQIFFELPASTRRN